MENLNEDILYKFVKYDDLKTEAIEYIKKIGYNTWNYYGESDPGITILENLLFAIIDLDYRISFPVEDILASKNSVNTKVKCFYMPEEILNASPVSLNDYYKLFLDIDGVINCKIIPTRDINNVNGCYDVYLYIDPNNEDYISDVKKKVKEKFYENRNLCEDINNLNVFDYFEVYVEGEFEPNYLNIDEVKNIEELISSILVDLQIFFVRRIPFYSLSQLLNEYQVSLDKIYNGPRLNNGFILDKELNKSRLLEDISILDIYEFLLKNKYISNILSFRLVNAKTNEVYTDRIKLKANQALRVNFLKSKIKIDVKDRDNILDNEKIITLSKRMYSYFLTRQYPNKEELGVYEGVYRNLKEYLTLLDDFPLIYNLDDDSKHLEKNNTTLLQNHSLKCFILIFDQILYIYQIMLENLKHYFSLNFNQKTIMTNKIPVNINDKEFLLKYPSEYDIFKNNYNEEFCIQRKYINEFNVDKSDKRTKIDTCNRYLDWLYKNEFKYLRESLLNFQIDLFSNINNSEDNSIVLSSGKSRRDYILNCNKIEGERAKACVLYQNISWEGDNISGLERKLCVFWNIKNINRRFLSKHLEDNFIYWINSENVNLNNYNKGFTTDYMYKSRYKNMFSLLLFYGDNRNNYHIENKSDYELIKDENVDDGVLLVKISISSDKNKFISIVNSKNTNINSKIVSNIIDKSIKNIREINIESEGVHVIENMLLRPRTCGDTDIYFYNYRITVVFPNWPKRFQNTIFREEMEEWINKSIPSHIKADIVWINYSDMKKFEFRYHEWWIKKNNIKTPNDELDMLSLNLTNTIKNLISKYKNTDTEESSVDILDDYINSYNILENPIR